ncbi:MAG: polyprenyl synthetase family protein [Chloroflexi bacterium]|nr:polyprenyl synthetase family protein [Chloroflexota bacterium]
MTVASIHEPVQQELAQVEETIAKVARSEIPQVQQMLQQVLSAGGKRLRPTVALLAGRFGEHRPEYLVPLAASIELLHTATLIHDDVIDDSDTRRGQPTTNSRYHNASAVMLGDYMFAHAADLICRTESIEVVKLFSRTLLAMAGGELTQDMAAYEYGQDTMQYFHRIAGKTASLFATSAEGGAKIAGASEEWIAALHDYGENLGMTFQIVDDILDFEGDEAELGKPTGSDLMAGTLTLPSLLLMERHPDDNPVKKLFADASNGREHLADAISMIRNTDILEESYKVAKDFRDRAVASLEVLPDTADRAALIDIADHVMKRRS